MRRNRKAENHRLQFTMMCELLEYDERLGKWVTMPLGKLGQRILLTGEMLSEVGLESEIVDDHWKRALGAFRKKMVELKWMERYFGVKDLT